MKKLPQAVQDLLKARDIMAERGLTKGSLEDAKGCVCVRGAINVAITGYARRWCDWGTWHSEQISETRRKAAEELLLAALDIQCIHSPELSQDNSSLVGYNNAPERTKEEMLSALEAAASLGMWED